MGYDKARFVGTTAFDVGIMQGIIAEQWRLHPEYNRNGDGKFQYVMIQTNLDNPESIVRTEFGVKEARNEGVDMQQVGDTLFCDWDDKMAHEVISLMFPLLADRVELVISNNDSMALNESGFNLPDGDPSWRIPVVGVDAVLKAVEAIRKGIMSRTAVQRTAKAWARPWRR